MLDTGLFRKEGDSANLSEPEKMGGLAARPKGALTLRKSVKWVPEMGRKGEGPDPKAWGISGFGL